MRVLWYRCEERGTCGFGWGQQGWRGSQGGPSSSSAPAVVVMAWPISLAWGCDAGTGSCAAGAGALAGAVANVVGSVLNGASPGVGGTVGASSRSRVRVVKAEFARERVVLKERRWLSGMGTRSGCGCVLAVGVVVSSSVVCSGSGSGRDSVSVGLG